MVQSNSKLQTTMKGTKMKIRITEIDSQSIRNMEWVGQPDEGYGDGTLTVQFQTGRLYDYYNVPFTEIGYLTTAESLGAYFNDVFKDVFGKDYLEVTPKELLDAISK